MSPGEQSSARSRSNGDRKRRSTITSGSFRLASLSLAASISVARAISHRGYIYVAIGVWFGPDEIEGKSDKLVSAFASASLVARNAHSGNLMSDISPNLTFSIFSRIYQQHRRRELPMPRRLESDNKATSHLGRVGRLVECYVDSGRQLATALPNSSGNVVYHVPRS